MSHSYIEKPVKKVKAYKGKAIDLNVDFVKLSTGTVATREYLDHPGAVAVIPIVDDKSSNPRILLVRQYRYPVNAMTWEIPAGKLSKGERPEVCVRRELEEETGFRAGKIEKFGSYWPTAAFANEVIHLYVARGLTKGRFNPDDDELIHPVPFRLDKILSMIKSGGIKDSKTVIGILFFDRWLR